MKNVQKRTQYFWKIRCENKPIEFLDIIRQKEKANYISPSRPSIPQFALLIIY